MRYAVRIILNPVQLFCIICIADAFVTPIHWFRQYFVVLGPKLMAYFLFDGTDIEAKSKDDRNVIFRVY